MTEESMDPSVGFASLKDDDKENSTHRHSEWGLSPEESIKH